MPAPDAAAQVVEVDPEVIEVELGVGPVLAGHHHDAAAVASYGGDGLGRARQQRHRLDRQRGVEGPEAIHRGGDLLTRQIVGEQVVQRRAERGGELGDRELDAELVAEDREHGADARTGVDQRHVKVEPDRQPLPHDLTLGLSFET